MASRRKILIADDSKENRMLLGGIFRDEYDILEAPNGAAALEILRSTPDISILLLDIVMPVLDGHGLLRQLKQEPQLSELPVVVLSESNISDGELISLDLGAWDFILKPYDARVVRRRVNNLIVRNELRDLKIKNTWLEEQARRAERDMLTGLYNSQTFFEHARQVIDEHPDRRYCMLHFDIAGFKLINDMFGYRTGDRLILHIAKIAGEIFTHESLICRLYADHFAVLLNADAFDYIGAVDEFCRRLSEFDIRFDLKAYFGLYRVRDRRTPINLMCDRALLALGTVKGSYNKRLGVYDDALRQRILAEKEIVSEMSSALADGQFVVYFQPQYNHDDGKIIGAEALVRWQHPTKGLISPDKFIPVFERNGFITELDCYVWERACAWLHDWLQRGGERLAISVNISRVDIFTQDLYGVLTGLVEKYSLPVELFRLEITESSYVYNAQQLCEIVKRLQRYGFLVEMDDFGSGYSSLNVLKDIPVDILKLDMRFLSCSDECSRGGSILSSVVQMADRLNMPVIAEGVETKEQADFLRSVGCPRMQGYYFSRPLPQNEFERWLLTRA